MIYHQREPKGPYNYGSQMALTVEQIGTAWFVIQSLWHPTQSRSGAWVQYAHDRRALSMVDGPMTEWADVEWRGPVYYESSESEVEP